MFFGKGGMSLRQGDMIAKNKKDPDDHFLGKIEKSGHEEEPDDHFLGKIEKSSHAGRGIRILLEYRRTLEKA